MNEGENHVPSIRDRLSKFYTEVKDDRLQ